MAFVMPRGAWFVAWYLGLLRGNAGMTRPSLGRARTCIRVLATGSGARSLASSQAGLFVSKALTSVDACSEDDILQAGDAFSAVKRSFVDQQTRRAFVAALGSAAPFAGLDTNAAAVGEPTVRPPSVVVNERQPLRRRTCLCVGVGSRARGVVGTVRLGAVRRCYPRRQRQSGTSAPASPSLCAFATSEHGCRVQSRGMPVCGPT
jgi:hypothetical protein